MNIVTKQNQCLSITRQMYLNEGYQSFEIIISNKEVHIAHIYGHIVCILELLILLIKHNNSDLTTHMYYTITNSYRYLMCLNQSKAT